MVVNIIVIIPKIIIFNRQKVFAALVSWLKTHCLSTHTLIVSKAANYQASVLRHIWNRVTNLTAITKVGACLDNCNAILYGTSKFIIHKLKRA